MKSSVAALALVCAMASSAAVAQTMALGVSAGTPGVGVQASAKISELIVLRGAVDGMSLSRDETYSDIDYDGKAKLLTGGVFADLHPGGGAFLVSGGAYFGQRKINLSARPTASVDIGGQVFTPAQIGRLDGEAKLSDLQPFLGVGFDTTFVGDRTWGFRALAGVSFSKAPDVKLAASGGTLSNDANFQARLRAEETQARDDAKDFKYFPVVQVGLTRRF
ncbi:hypothetical protein [Phenylobacterium sp.]|uniref:hypothetical protein n=1 Tax=Phenylobacterium sp. TaxID=1871053 RepID=UPI00286B5B36|nr:hypothetical protein [Phenylobacterium sp.]